MAHKMFVLVTQGAYLAYLFSFVSLTTCTPHTGSLDDQDPETPGPNEKPTEEDPSDDHDSGPGGSLGQGESDLNYCTIQPIFAAKCLRCHGDPLENGAPVALDHAAAFHEPWGSSKAPLYERVGEVIEIDFMPATWLKDVEPPVEPLTSNEKDLLLRWIDAGAPLEPDASACEE